MLGAVYGFAIDGDAAGRIVGFGGLEMTLLQAAMIIVGVGFGLALISSIVAWNGVTGPKPRLANLAVPFAVKWALYSGGVAVALGVQHLLLAMRA
jgi:hypothetical protein